MTKDCRMVVVVVVVVVVDMLHWRYSAVVVDKAKKSKDYLGVG